MRSWKHVLVIFTLFLVITFGGGWLATVILERPGDPWDAGLVHFCLGVVAGIVLWVIIAIAILKSRTTHKDS